MNQYERAENGKGYYHGIEKECGQSFQKEGHKHFLITHQSEAVQGFKASEHTADKQCLESLYLQENEHRNKVEVLSHQRVFYLGKRVEDR